ncbi:MFS transporter [Amycolatopsis sp. cmx-4-61]|uniref:MFS transporter n=1 Tax=Amycolatopsis sp. cmx-4-61 TaxID=2790937 RepID=UPI003978E495
MRVFVVVGENSSFRRFWLGMLISRTGDVVTVVALSWLVLDMAGPAELGLVVLCQGLPRVVAGPLAGRLLDQVPPRLLLGWDNAVRGVLIGLVPVLWSLGGLDVAVLCVLSACAAVSSTLTEVAESAVVPRLVPEPELDAANTALATNWEAAAVLGPPLAGALVAVATAPVALVVDAVSFFVMSALCFTLPTLEPVPADGTRPGFGAILRLPVVLWTSVATCGFLFLGGMSEVLYPVLSREVLHTGPVGYGLLVGAAGAGGLAGVVVGVPLVTRLRPKWRIPVIVMAGAVPFAVLTVTGALMPAVVLVAVAGACWGPYFAVERTLVQRRTPDAVRGSVMGARAAISALGFPAGSAVAGTLSARLGPLLVVAIATAGYLLVAATVFMAMQRGEAGSRPRTPARWQHS